MSKKKKGKGKKAPARYKASASRQARAIDKRAAKGPRKLAAKGPRSQPLPGMERVRNTKLDGYCEDARDGLVSIDSGTSAVADAKTGAMRELQRIGRSSYVHAGVRFTHTPGVDKVSVKRIKETEFTGASPASPEAPAAEETGDDDLGDDEPAGDFAEPGIGDVH